jgi:hypothetical protein
MGMKWRLIRANVKVTFLLLSFLLVFYCSGAQTDCDLKKSANDIFVYACKSSDSKLKSITSTFLVEATPSLLAAHVMNIEEYTAWQYKVIKTELLERISDQELIYRGEVQAPWPVSNRDLVVRLKISQDPITKVMTILANSIPNYLPEKSGIVRVPRSETKWVITPVDRDRLKVEYFFVVDPGGSLPSWLVNLTIAEGPYKTFQNLIARIGDGTPISPLAFIRD